MKPTSEGAPVRSGKKTGDRLEGMKNSGSRPNGKSETLKCSQMRSATINDADVCYWRGLRSRKLNPPVRSSAPPTSRNYVKARAFEYLVLTKVHYAKSFRRSRFGSLYRSGWLLGPKGRQRRQGRRRTRWSGGITWTARTGRPARQGWQRRGIANGPIPGGTIRCRRSDVQARYVRRHRSDRQRDVRFEARIDE
jgi:hypothetical protein